MRISYYNALGAFFEALIQRTDGCTNLLWLLVSHKRNILIAQNNRDSTFQAFKYAMACKLELYDLIKLHEVVVSRFISDQKQPIVNNKQKLHFYNQTVYVFVLQKLAIYYQITGLRPIYVMFFKFMDISFQMKNNYDIWL